MLTHGYPYFITEFSFFSYKKYNIYPIFYTLEDLKWDNFTVKIRMFPPYIMIN